MSFSCVSVVRFRKKQVCALRPAWLVAAVLACAAAPAVAQSAPAPAADPRIAQVLSELGKARNIHQAALSPDGKSLAWVVDGEHGGAEIQLAALPSVGSGASSMPLAPRQVTAGEKDSVCIEEDVAWSPDSSSLAFLSDCQTHSQPDIYVFEAASKRPPRRLTHLRGFAKALQWSPDGSRVSFLYVEGGTRPAGALAAMKPPAGVIGEDGLEIQRVDSVRTADGEFRQLTPATLHVYEFDWSPNSAKLAYIAAPPPGENNWWVAQLYTQLVGNPADEGDAHSILNPATISGPLHGLQIAVPRWSPDGKYIAFIGGLMSDQGSTGGNLYFLRADGGSPRRLPTGSHRSIAWFTWLLHENVSDAAHILSSEIVDGSTMVFDYIIDRLPACFSDETTDAAPGCDVVERNLMHAEATILSGGLEGSLSVSTGGNRLAFIRSSFSEPTELFTGSLRLSAPAKGDRGEIVAQPATHYNDSLKPAWGKAESVQWTNEGLPVQGWLIYPANYGPAKKYPMVVMVHGGPASAVIPRWPEAQFGALPFAALGYFAFEPNPRGSYGEGEAFTQANRKDFGYGDLRDILAGVDAVTSRYPIDPDRIGIAGWSYGGFMTMFAVTQTQRFHAAVAGAGISDWQSYYGENSIDQWMVPYFGATVYDDPAVYAKSSAIDFIKQAKTPTLVVVGDRDGECPAPQSFEFWHALRAENVPTQLVVYPDEGHRFSDPDHRIDVIARALAWFEQYMPPEKAH